MTNLKKTKKWKLSLFTYAIFVSILAIALFLIYQKANRTHTISYDGVIFTPEFIVLHLGDSVNIKNTSQTEIEAAVGKHENHQRLKGFQEKIIKPKEGYTFTPLEKGVFDLHNHLNPKNTGYLIIDK